MYGSQRVFTSATVVRSFLFTFPTMWRRWVGFLVQV